MILFIQKRNCTVRKKFHKIKTKNDLINYKNNKLKLVI